MKHLPAALLGLLAIGFAFLYVSSSRPPGGWGGPEAPTGMGEDARDAELAALRALVLEQKLRIAELEVAALEVESRSGGRARFADVPDPEDALAQAVPAEADSRPPGEALEAELGAKIGSALGQLFQGVDLSNVVEGTKVSIQGDGAGSIGGAFKRQSAAAARGQAELRYADFMSGIDLGFEPRQHFLDLLAARDHLPWREGFLDNEAIEQHHASVEAMLSAFLGEDGYGQLQAYEDSEYARGKVRALEQALGQGLALQPAQRDKMQSLFDGMEAFSEDFQGRMGRAGAEARLDELTDRYNQLTETAGAFLDEKQTAALATHLETHLKQAEAQEALLGTFRKQLGAGADIQLLGGDASGFQPFGQGGVQGVIGVQGIEVFPPKPDDP